MCSDLVIDKSKCCVGFHALHNLSVNQSICAAQLTFKITSHITLIYILYSVLYATLLRDIGQNALFCQLGLEEIQYLWDTAK